MIGSVGIADEQSCLTFDDQRIWPGLGWLWSDLHVWCGLAEYHDSKKQGEDDENGQVFEIHLL